MDAFKKINEQKQQSSIDKKIISMLDPKVLKYFAGQSMSKAQSKDSSSSDEDSDVSKGNIEVPEEQANKNKIK